MPRKTSNNTTAPEGDEPEKKGRKPGPARQTLLDAADGKETVLTFTSPDLAKGSAYGWWGARRRAGLTEKVSISLDTKAMTVTIGARKPEEAGAEQNDAGQSENAEPIAADAVEPSGKDAVERAGNEEEAVAQGQPNDEEHTAEEPEVDA